MDDLRDVMNDLRDVMDDLRDVMDDLRDVMDDLRDVNLMGGQMKRGDRFLKDVQMKGRDLLVYLVDRYALSFFSPIENYAIKIKKRALIAQRPFYNLSPASFYSPTRSPVQYHRRCEA